MKTIAITLAILGSSLINTSSGKETLDINSELKKVINFNENKLKMERNHTAFVRVSFQFNEDGEVEILEMNYSDENVKSQLIEKLSKMKINKNQNNNETYNYNFKFKKL